MLTNFSKVISKIIALRTKYPTQVFNTIGNKATYRRFSCLHHLGNFSGFAFVNVSKLQRLPSIRGEFFHRNPQHHEAFIFIRDFAPDFSSFNETIVPATAGPFSISLATLPGAGRNVQYGFQVRGVNVWDTDADPFGNIVIGTIPEPATLSLLGFGAVALLRRRR